MANLTDVIDYLSTLTEDSLEESIRELKSEIDRMQKLVCLLEAMRSGFAKPQTNGKHTNGVHREPEIQTNKQKQLETIHEFLRTSGPSNCVRVSRTLDIHHRRVDKLVRDNPARFRIADNGDYEAIETE